eukprot:Awhi_evm1s13195
MKYFSTSCLLGLGFFGNSLGDLGQRVRGDDGLAPELHRNHPHRSQRSESHRKYTVCFNKNTSSNELEAFESVFNEFITERIPNFDLVQVEVPHAMVDEVLLDIRSQTIVSVVENVLTLQSHNIYWNKARIASNAMPEKYSGNQEFHGSGFDADIYVIDT